MRIFRQLAHAVTASLSFRVLLMLVGVVSLTMLLAQGLSLRAAYQARSHLLSDRAAQVATLAAAGVAHPLFDFNTPVVESLVAALANDPDFLGAEVFDSDGKVISSAGAVVDAEPAAIVVRRDVRFDNNGTKTPVGSLTLRLSRASVARYLHQQLVQSATTVVLLLLVVIVTVSLSLRRISKPLHDMRGAMERLATGDIGSEIGGGGRNDEIGAMARALSVFRDNLRALRDMDQEQQTEAQAKEARRLALGDLTRDFVVRIDAVAGQVTGAAQTTHQNAGSLFETAGNMRDRATAVADAAGQASRNVDSVAALTDELSAAISEITRETSLAGSVTAKAVEEATASTTTVHGLTAAAERIGTVVQFIGTIASQTNLLAPFARVAIFNNRLWARAPFSTHLIPVKSAS